MTGRHKCSINVIHPNIKRTNSRGPHPPNSNTTYPANVPIVPLIVPYESQLIIPSNSPNESQQIVPSNSPHESQQIVLSNSPVLFANLPLTNTRRLDANGFLKELLQLAQMHVLVASCGGGTRSTTDVLNRSLSGRGGRGSLREIHQLLLRSAKARLQVAPSAHVLVLLLHPKHFRRWVLLQLVDHKVVRKWR